MHDKLQILSEKRKVFFYAHLVIFVILIVYYLIFHKEAEMMFGGNTAIFLVGVAFMALITYVQGENKNRSLEGELNEAQEKIKKLKIEKGKARWGKPRKISLKEQLRNMKPGMMIRTLIFTGAIVYFIYNFFDFAVRKDVEPALWSLFLLTFVIQSGLRFYQENSLKNKLSEAKNILKDANLEQ